MINALVERGSALLRLEDLSKDACTFFADPRQYAEKVGTIDLVPTAATVGTFTVTIQPAAAVAQQRDARGELVTFITCSEGWADRDQACVARPRLSQQTWRYPTSTTAQRLFVPHDIDCATGDVQTCLLSMQQAPWLARMPLHLTLSASDADAPVVRQFVEGLSVRLTLEFLPR